MAITVTPESKNTLTITNEAKVTGINDTLADRDWTLAEDDGTLGLPGLHITKETKNAITITPESKT